MKNILNLGLLTEFFLAWRYLKPKRTAVSVITCVSIVGVTLGVAVLIVVIAVMTGFTDEMKKKMLETMAHIQVSDFTYGYIGDPDKVIGTAKSLGCRASPIVQRPALVQSKGQFLPKVVIGIYPEMGKESIPVSEFIQDGKFSLNKGEVLISNILANELHAGIGDKLIIHAPSKLAEMVKFHKEGGVEFNERSKVYLPEEFRISGIYSFGKYDFDESVLFVNLDDADELFGLPWGAATAVFIRTENPFHINPVLTELREKLPHMQVFSWKQLNRKFLGVLAVEKNMMFFLLIFIVLVAAFSISNTLIMVVLKKTREIGLLKALGATSGTVMRIFIIQGSIVGFVGTGLGTLLGITIIRWRNEIMYALRIITGIEIFPKEYYFFSELPASVVPQDLLIIGLVSMILCTLGGILPAWRAARLNPAGALRYE